MRLSVGSVRPLSIRLRVGALFTRLCRGAQRKAGPGQNHRSRWVSNPGVHARWFMASCVREAPRAVLFGV